MKEGAPVLRSRRLGLVAGTAALVVAVGACGGGSSASTTTTGKGNGATRVVTRDPVRLIASSADEASAAKTARMSMSLTFSGGGNSGTIAADGAFDFQAPAGQLTMDMSSLGIPGASGKLEMRVLGTVAYMNLGSVPGAGGAGLGRVLGGKHWFKADLSRLAGGSGSKGMGTLGASDPSSMLDALRGVSSDVREVGTDTVRGVATTHYAITIDMQKALRNVPANQRPQAVDGLKQFGAGSLPADVWLDGRGLPRKFVMSFDAFNTPDVSMGPMTMEFYDYGVAVDVQPPPADDTVDMMSALGGLGGLGALDANTGSA